MEIPEGHFRHILRFYFRIRKNAAQAHWKLCSVYGDECLASVQIGLLVFVPEISMLKMNLTLAGQSLKNSLKFFEKSR